MPNKQQKSHSKGRVRSDVKLDGKTVVITGANQGIGYETALDLAGRGAKVIMACRDIQKAEEAKNKIISTHPSADLVVRKLDLASLESVRDFAKVINETEPKLHILINNAGVMSCPQWKTKEGYEMQLGVNHIGHFLLTNLLLDLLKKSAPSRIIIVSSMVHKLGELNWNDIMLEKNYDSWSAYCASKLANIHHCLELSARLKGTGVTCNCLHPGIVKTHLFQYSRDEHNSCWIRLYTNLCWSCMRNCISISPNQGAQTSIYCAIAPELDEVTGKYFNSCKIEQLQRRALNAADREKLWQLSEEWVKED